MMTCATSSEKWRSSRCVASRLSTPKHDALASSLKRNCDDDVECALGTRGIGRRPDGRTRRESIVDDDYRLARNIGGWSLVAVQTFPSLELPLLASSDSFDIVGFDAKHLHQVAVENANPTAGDRAHRQLFVTGNAELPDEEDIQGSAELLGDFVADGHTATRECEDQQIRPIRVFGKGARQTPACIVSIEKIRSHRRSFRAASSFVAEN